ncbi:sporulation protein YunB [Halalkalibacterium ligniniphilum]|uniref:sporulation protein YunB n=1 Tax=Halalkalibacterium ligniniphilum TaxID=1134413 RepID=UPI0003496F78|nr:sporulation protein YunB [Halalkalibacterium ligniniphilum]
MRRRRPIRRARKGPLPFRYVLLISFVVFVLLTLQGLWIVEKGVKPTLMEIASLETQKISTTAINGAINDKVSKEIDINELYLFEKDENGEITSVQFNTNLYNEILSSATGHIQSYLAEVERESFVAEQNGTDDGILYEIPLGRVTNNALLSQLGPGVPFHFTVIGDVRTDFKEKVEHVGINNTYITLSMEIELDIRVIIPFATEQQLVFANVPVGVLFISGPVPEFYMHGEGVTPPPIAVPMSEREEAASP